MELYKPKLRSCYVPSGSASSYFIISLLLKWYWFICHNLLSTSFSPDDSVLCQHTSSPLGNGAVVETIDNKILVLQRSNNVGEFPGHFVFPGGHPEVLNGEMNVLNPFDAIVHFFSILNLERTVCSKINLWFDLSWYVLLFCFTILFSALFYCTVLSSIKWLIH